MKKARRALLLGGFVFLAACPGEPSPILATRIELPAGTTPAVTLDPAKLHLILDGRPAYSVPTPSSVAHPSGNGFDLQLELGIGPQVDVKLHVWYDVNGNGVEDHGDAAGDLFPSPFTAVDEGGCASRINTAPPILLRMIP